MLRLDNIVIPKDFSHCSAAALKCGLDLAVRTGATLHTLFAEVLHGDLGVHAPGPTYHECEAVREMQGWEDALRHARLGAAAAAVPVVHAVVRDLAPGQAILHYAEEQSADLIVMGTHGRYGLPRLLMGSVAEEVVRFAPCPVLTVRCNAGDPAPSLQLRTICVQMDDGEAASLEALRWANALAEQAGARLVVMHVIDKHEEAGQGADFRRREADALEALRAWSAPGLGAEAAYRVCHGDPVLAGARLAADAGADLLAAALQPSGLLRHMLRGDPTEQRLRLAPCPVLTVKAPALVRRPAAPAHA